ncbi:MAG: hypothetical protein AAB074_11440 [Planctomycetota bacterium]
MKDDILSQARRLAEVLSSNRINHAFIGGLAMNAWSIPAPTYDIDLCADLTRPLVFAWRLASPATGIGNLR